MVFTAGLLCAFVPSMAQKSGKLVSVGFGIETGIPVGTASTLSILFRCNCPLSVHAGPGLLLLPQAELFSLQRISNKL